MVAPAVIITLFESAALRQLVTTFVTSFGGSALANKVTAGSEDICGCLSNVEALLSKIDATLTDGFSGRNVDLEGTRRRLNRAGADKLFTEGAIGATKDELARRKIASKGFPGGRNDLIIALEKDLAALEAQEQVLEALIETLKAEQERLEAEPDAPSATLIDALKQLATAIGGEEGLLAAFLELDQALQSAKLPGELENLADAVATAAARIANAVGSAPEKKAPDGSPSEFASGGTVAPGQPVLVGERGPEIFVPSAAGTIVNAFDASADPSAIGASGSSGPIVQALESLEDTISELDETIQDAESAGLNGVGGAGRPSASGRRFGSRGTGSGPLDEVENFLDTLESTSEAFGNIERTMREFRDLSEDSFGNIAAAGQQAFQSILGSIQSWSRTSSAARPGAFTRMATNLTIAIGGNISWQRRGV